MFDPAPTHEGVADEPENAGAPHWRTLGGHRQLEEANISWGMMREATLRRLLFTLMFIILAGCGPRTMKSVLFPVVYDVRVDADVRDGNGVYTETTFAHCNVFDEMDSIAANIHTTQTGGKIWRRLSSGSTLVVQGLGVCPWKKSIPDMGTVFIERPDDYSDVTKLSYIFSAGNAYVVDAIPDKMLFNGAVAPAVEAVKITVVPHTVLRNNIESSFPELQHIVKYEKEMALRHVMLGGGMNPRLRTGLYVGVAGEAWRIHGIPRCQSPDGQPIILHSDDECQYMNHPCANYRSNLTVGGECEEYLGRLLPKPNNDFSEFDASFRDFQRYVEFRLYSADALIRAGRGIAGEKFQPKICVNGLCATPTRPDIITLMYFPNENIVVRVWSEGDNVFPSEIGYQVG